MIITIDNKIHLQLSELRPETVKEIQSKLSFKNLAWGEAVGRLRAQGHANPNPYGIPQMIIGWRKSSTELLLPRAISSNIIAMFPDAQVINKTHRLPEVKFGFDGELKPAQIPAVEAILSRKFGSISSPTGSGKTVMGLWCIFVRKQPTLVVVHTTALMKQWVERAHQFLGLPIDEIGIIGQGKKTVGKRLTIALVQTLKKCAAEVVPKIGHLIIDECHHTPATTFTEAIEPFDCAFSLGLSATHKRRDGLTALIYWHVGPLVYEVKHSTLIRDGDIIQVDPIIRKTNYTPSPDIDPIWQRAAMMTELCQDHQRNLLIVADIKNEAMNGPCIVLTDRKTHAEDLVMLLNHERVNAEVCHGGVPRKEQESLIAAMNDGRLRVLVATGQLLGEGFDCKHLTALFLATPIKFSGRLIQYLGRVARSADGKTSARVYDYVDSLVPILMTAARERMRTYKKLAKAGRETTAPTLKKE